MSEEFEITLALAQKIVGWMKQLSFPFPPVKLFGKEMMQMGGDPLASGKHRLGQRSKHIFGYSRSSKHTKNPGNNLAIESLPVFPSTLEATLPRQSYTPMLLIPTTLASWYYLIKLPPFHYSPFQILQIFQT
jgi:hypothetical protein